MAAQAIRLPITGEESVSRPVAEVVLPSEGTARILPLPFISPLLRPRAVEALLLAFGPLDEDRPASLSGGSGA